MRILALVLAISTSGCAATTTTGRVFGTISLVTVASAETGFFYLPERTPTELGVEAALLTTGLLAAAIALHADARAESAAAVTSASTPELVGGIGTAVTDDHAGSAAVGGGKPAVDPQHTYYDGTGLNAGRRDAQRNFYDATGAYAGRTDAQGTYYDRTGVDTGRVDAQQNYYTGTGAYAGRLDASGTLYDGTGLNAGRIDDQGNIYDARGLYAGHVDGDCDDACKRDAAARVLLPQ